MLNAGASGNVVGETGKAADKGYSPCSRTSLSPVFLLSQIFKLDQARFLCREPDSLQSLRRGLGTGLQHLLLPRDQGNPGVDQHHAAPVVR